MADLAAIHRREAAQMEGVVRRAAAFGATPADHRESEAILRRQLERLRLKVDAEWDELVARLDSDAERRAAGQLRGAERRRQLTSLAGSMRTRGLTSVEILPTLLAVNAYRCAPPLTNAEVLGIARAVEKRRPSYPITGAKAA